MNRITGLKIDKRLALNVDMLNPVEPDKSQLIKVTVTVVDSNDNTQENILVRWSSSLSTMLLLNVYDANMNLVNDLLGTGVRTDSNGNAIIYIGAYNKTIFNIGAYLEGDSSEQMRASVAEYQQTLVFCSFEQSEDTHLPAPSLPTDSSDGSVLIEDNNTFSIQATADAYTGNGGYIATWMYGRIDGYEDGERGGRLISVEEYNSKAPININVPFQWMIADGSLTNQLSYLIYNDSGSQAKNLFFAAEGNATAMPDIDQDGADGYDALVYAYQDSQEGKVVLLSDTDLSLHNDALDFVVPKYPNQSDTDKIEISIYLNAWGSMGLNPKKKYISHTYTLSQLKGADGQYIFSLPAAAVKGYQAKIDRTTGTMFTRYKINDRDLLLSKIWMYNINFA